MALPIEKTKGGPHACFDSNLRQVMVCWKLYWHVLILLLITLNSIQWCHSEPPVQLISDTLGKINPFMPSHHLQNGRELLRIQPKGLVDLMKALDVLGIHDVTWKHGSCHGSSHIISHQIIVANSPGTLKKMISLRKNLTKIKTRYSKMRGSQHHINGISWNHPRPSTSHLFPGSFHFQKGSPT